MHNHSELSRKLPKTKADDSDLYDGNGIMESIRLAISSILGVKLLCFLSPISLEACLQVEMPILTYEKYYETTI